MAKISSYADGGNPAAADQFIIVRSGVNKKLVWNTIYTYLATLFALTSKGVTNGDSHDHVGGDGAAIGTNALSNDAVTYAKMQNVSATDKVLGRSSVGAGDVEEIPCTAAARALLALASAFVDKTAFTPTILGTTDAGVGTYTTQIGYYSRIGNIVFVEIYMVWTNIAGGTGNLRLGNLPIASADNGVFVPLTIQWGNLTLAAVGNKVFCLIPPNAQYANLYQIADGNYSALGIDTAGTLMATGFYFV